jgi:hypothetical protein
MAAALSLASAVRRDTPDSVALDLATGRTKAITDTPGYTETTIFSPDERLDITTTRFSARTDPTILELMPRPYLASLNMALSMFAYTYAVASIRLSGEDNVEPALIDMRASGTQDNDPGRNLNTEGDWVFRSPLSWHSGRTRAMWIEGMRGTDRVRMRKVGLPDDHPARAVPPEVMPRTIAGSSFDMAVVKGFAR